jgi:hypothetical protein
MANPQFHSRRDVSGCPEHLGAAEHAVAIRLTSISIRLRSAHNGWITSWLSPPLMAASWTSVCSGCLEHHPQ